MTSLVFLQSAIARYTVTHKITFAKSVNHHKKIFHCTCCLLLSSFSCFLHDSFFSVEWLFVWFSFVPNKEEGFMQDWPLNWHLRIAIKHVCLSRSRGSACPFKAVAGTEQVLKLDKENQTKQNETNTLHVFMYLLHKIIQYNIGY